MGCLEGEGENKKEAVTCRCVGGALCHYSPASLFNIAVGLKEISSFFVNAALNVRHLLCKANSSAREQDGSGWQGRPGKGSAASRVRKERRPEIGKIASGLLAAGSM